MDCRYRGEYIHLVATGAKFFRDIVGFEQNFNEDQNCHLGTDIDLAVEAVEIDKRHRSAEALSAYRYPAWKGTGSV